jgi:Uma2 family endonuclease
MNEEEFFEFCEHNPDLQIEQDKHGNLIIMSPVSLDTGNLENQINTDLTNWDRVKKLGKTYSPSTLFILPDGEKRMADAAWVSKDKIAKLSLKERRAFAHIVPDFIVELKSPSDHPADIEKKIRDAWIANGVGMAWYIDPDEQISKIYLADGTVEVIKGFDKVLSGGDVLPGFEFHLSVLLT